jgi:hypothetical protein
MTVTVKLTRGQRLVLRLVAERRLLANVDKHGWPYSIAVAHPKSQPLSAEERSVGRVNIRYCLGAGLIAPTEEKMQGRCVLALTDAGVLVAEQHPDVIKSVGALDAWTTYSKAKDSFDRRFAEWKAGGEQGPPPPRPIMPHTPGPG